MAGGGKSGGDSYWPGFVDALTNVVIAMIFVVVVLYPVAYGLWLARHPSSYVALANDPVFFRTVINTGRDGGQEVMHLHMHVMGGPRPWLKG